MPAGRGQRETWIAVIPGALLALILTAWRYDAKPMWRDEFYTYGTVETSTASMLQIIRGPDIGLVAYYALMHGWMLIGDSTAWLRLPGALLTVVLVILTALLGRRLAGPVAGSIAGVLIALAPAAVTHAQEARAYPLVLTACTALALTLVSCREAPSRSRRAAVVVTASCAVAAHPLVGVPAVVGLFLAALLRPGRERRAVLLLLGVLPGLAASLLIAAGFLLRTGVTPGATDLPGLLGFSQNLARSPVAAVTVCAVALAGAVVLRRRSTEAGLLVLWIAVPLVVIGGLGLAGSYSQFRYVASMTPAVAVLAGVGLSTALVGMRPRRAASGLRVVAGVALVTAVLLMAVDAARFRSAPYAVDDPVGVAHVLEGRVEAGDAIVYTGRVTRGLVQHYTNDELELDDVLLAQTPEASGTLRGRLIPSDEYEEALRGADRVWLVGTTNGGVLADPVESAAVREGRVVALTGRFGGLVCELWVR